MQPTNSVEEYSLFRNRIVDILSEVTVLAEKYPNFFAVQVGNKSAAETLNKMAKRYKENQFRMTLCGGFQGGKSTTFNILSGGRRISPTGIGIKTSACVVEACNLSEEGAEEYAEIIWKTNAEVVKGFQSSFAIAFSIFIESEKFPISIPESACEMSDWFDFSNDSHFDAFVKFIDFEYSNYKHNKRDYSRDKLDILKYAKIVCDHIKDNYIQERMSEKVSKCRIDEIQNVVKFPEKFSRRFSDFSTEEITYAFVNKVVMHIKSPELEKLGCCLVDAPGLFISDWDTMVTRDAIDKSDAVLFLIQADKEIDQQGEKAFNEVTVKGNNNTSVFLLFNQWGKEKEFTEEIVESSMDKLRCSLPDDSDLEDDMVSVFNARLALNALNHEFSCKDFEFDSRICEIPSEVIKNPEQNLDTILKYSGLPELKEKVENFILNQKGGRALRAGINVIQNNMSSVEQYIKTMEDVLNEKAEESKKKWDDEEKRLKEFVSFAEGVKNGIGSGYDEDFRGLLYSHLRLKVYNLLKEHYFDVEKAFAADGIMTLVKDSLKGFGIVKKDFKQVLAGKIAAAVSQKLPKIYSETCSIVKKDKNIQLLTDKRIKSVKNEIDRRWESSDVKNATYLNITDYEFYESTNSFDVRDIDINIPWKARILSIIIATGEVWVDVFSWVGKKLTGIDTPVKWFEKADAAKIDGLFKKIRTSDLYNKVMDPVFNDMVEQITDQFAKSVNNFIKNQIETSILEPVQSSFKKNREEAEALYKKTEMERKAQSKEFRRIRKSSILPIVEKTNALATEINAWADASLK